MGVRSLDQVHAETALPELRRDSTLALLLAATLTRAAPVVVWFATAPRLVLR